LVDITLRELAMFRNFEKQQKYCWPTVG